MITTGETDSTDNPMFNDMPALTTFDTTNGNLELWGAAGNRMFYGDGAVTDIKGMGDWDVSHIGHYGAGATQMFLGCIRLKAIDLTNWNNSHAVDWGVFDSIFPTDFASSTPLHNLQHLTFGPTRIFKYPQALTNQLDGNQRWDIVTHTANKCATLTYFGNTASVAAHVTSSNPAGDFYREGSGITPPCVKITSVNANGGTGGGSVDLQADTSAGTGSVTMPSATMITGNKANSLWDHWDTNSAGTGGNNWPSNRTVYFPKDTNATYTLYAQWRAAPAPKANRPTVTVPTSGSPTTRLTVDNPATHYNSEVLHVAASSAGGAAWCPSSGGCTYTYPGGGTGGTVYWTPSVGELQADYGDTYTISTWVTLTDPSTTRAVSTVPSTTNGSELTGILPYAKVGFDANGGTGAPAGTVQGLVDTASGYTRVTVPTGTIPIGAIDSGQGVSHLAFIGWSTSSTATAADATLNPGKQLGGIGAKTLYAVWKTVATPTNMGAVRIASNNQIRITGSATPWASTDTVTACVKPTGSAETAWQCANTGSADSQWDATSLSWNGANTHTWAVTLPHNADTIRAGQYDIKAYLGTNGPWQASNTAISLNTTASLRLSGAQSGLPLTGGRPQRLATLMAGGIGATLLLLAAVTCLRNQRRKARHSR
ncbi:hypothetical protein OZX57_01935 [Bifidobacterium sp. ESL0682]|uniref:hypothetical protein n=1 Tax=Bifidobacterium sp. ESL0682 TaxID=2983212 RepID=UPI0023F6CEA7|nr:hypothetical protein [Bifidobacterium sp. ESL0682]WEV42269.1 hypothetical protein OZX57_01935 [Bifidobacterium sp. ESL0682]